jgi:hypothetical protein
MGRGADAFRQNVNAASGIYSNFYGKKKIEENSLQKGFKCI